MWFFKAPKINSKNVLYFHWAHHFELIALFSIPLIILSFWININPRVTWFLFALLFTAEIFCWLILAFVGIIKKEALQFKSVLIVFAMVFGGVQPETRKGPRAVTVGVINLIAAVILGYAFITTVI